MNYYKFKEQHIDKYKASENNSSNFVPWYSTSFTVWTDFSTRIFRRFLVRCIGHDGNELTRTVLLKGIFYGKVVNAWWVRPSICDGRPDVSKICFEISITELKQLVKMTRTNPLNILKTVSFPGITFSIFVQMKSVDWVVSLVFNHSGADLSWKKIAGFGGVAGRHV